VEKVKESEGEFSVVCSFRSVKYQFPWAFVGVYLPNIDRDRRLLWDELSGLISWRNLPWLILGNFNVSKFPSERLSNARIGPAMVELSYL